MLKIWLGRAGSGKSDRILDQIKVRREIRPQILLVPEHVSFEAEKDLCLALGDTASLNTEALSFANLSRRVLGECGGLSDVTLDTGGKMLTMRRCLQELSGQLKIFSKPSGKIGFLQELVALMDEFYAYEVSSEQLLKNIENIEGSSGDKLRDIALIYAAYDYKIHGNMHDSRSRVQKMRDALPNSTYLRGKDLYFDGFSYFNQLEESIIRVALHQANDIVVALLGDEKDVSLFKNAFETKERLIRLASEEQIPYEFVHLTTNTNGEIEHLEQHLFGDDQPWTEPVSKITVFEAENTYREIEDVACKILQLVQKEGYRYRDISVSCRNMDSYGPVIENIFKREHIPAYISERNDILEKNVLKLLVSALEVVTGGFEYEDMFRYLKSGLSGISQEDCDELENYVILWNIHGDSWMREKDWGMNPLGYQRQIGEKEQQKLQHINRLRHQIQKQLSVLYEGMNIRSNAKDKAVVLYTFAEKLGVASTLKIMAQESMEEGNQQKAQELRQLWSIFCTILDQFVEIVGDIEMNGEEFTKLFRLLCSQYSVATIPATLDQVKVTEMTRNDRHDVKVTFLLGANDHVIPQVNQSTGILDIEERELLSENNVFLSTKTFDPLDNELQNIYACVVQPKDHLYISYPVTDLRGEVLRPSFIVTRIGKLFPKLQIKKPSAQLRESLPSAALIEAGKHVNGDLWQYFEEKETYRDVLQSMLNAKAQQRGTLTDAGVEALYGDELKMSASRIDRLNTCHFSYFMQYGLTAKERGVAEFEAPEIGSLIHYILENITTEVMEQGGFKSISQNDLDALVSKHMDVYTEQEVQGFDEKNARFKYLFTRLRETAKKIVADVAEELRHSDFKPLSTELGFGGKDAELPAIVVADPNAKLTMTGKIDRVDGWEHDGKLYLRVVDYKTGKKAFSLSDIGYGLNTQMLLYLFSLKKEGADYYGYDIVPSGVLYLPARDEILSQSRNISDEALDEAFKKNLKRSGLVLSDPEVLKAMEHEVLDQPSYLPVTKTKAGISGSIVNKEQFDSLHQHIKTMLSNVAKDIHKGNIDADPISDTPETSPCSYCPYVKACSFEDGCGSDHRRYKKKIKDDEFWEIIANNGKEEPANE